MHWPFSTLNFVTWLIKDWPECIPSCLWVWWQERPWLTDAEQKTKKKRHNHQDSRTDRSSSVIWVLQEQRTIDTGFQVEPAAALGCQLDPPVILFSPGWFHWTSLQTQNQNSVYDSTKANVCIKKLGSRLTFSSCHFQCPDLRQGNRK